MSDPQHPEPPPAPEGPSSPNQRPEPAERTAPDPVYTPPQPRGRRRLLMIIAAALGGFIACAGIALALFVAFTPAVRNRLPFLAALAGAQPPPEAPNKFVALPAGPVTINDDFSTASRTWDRSQNRITNGRYELTLELDNFDSYGLFLGGDVRDFDLAVDATATNGPLNGEFGIRFRQSAPDEHMLFSISPSGYYRLVRVSNRTFTSLVPWTREARINPGLGVANRLRVVADGPTITGYINGEQVLTYTDDKQERGQLTLGLVTFDTGGLTVGFDNLEGFAMATLANGQAARLDMAEDFADPATADWSVGGATISNSAYEIFIDGPVLTWQQPLPTGSSQVGDNFVFEVDAAMVGGPGNDAAYGVMFGDNGAFNFFAIAIVPDGRLMMYRNGPDGGLIIPPVPVPAINAGLDATNRLRIEVRGQRLTITINDEVLPELEFPPEFSLSGRAGLFLQGTDTEEVRARFDNFKLEEIE